eukprot:210089-Lingulodinium_polyedra.AAC.1
MRWHRNPEHIAKTWLTESWRCVCNPVAYGKPVTECNNGWPLAIRYKSVTDRPPPVMRGITVFATPTPLCATRHSAPAGRKPIETKTLQHA